MFGLDQAQPADEDLEALLHPVGIDRHARTARLLQGQAQLHEFDLELEQAPDQGIVLKTLGGIEQLHLACLQRAHGGKGQQQHGAHRRQQQAQATARTCRLDFHGDGAHRRTSAFTCQAERL